MGTRRGTLFVFVFLIQANFLALAQISCINNGMNYTTNTSTYRTNLNAAFSTLSTSLDINGFSNASMGQGPDRANAIILCRGDIQLDECRSCLQNAIGGVLEECPNQKQAIIWNEQCMLRYSNETILGRVMTTSGWYLSNTQNVTNPDEFVADLRTIMDDLRRRAANGGSLRKVGAGNITRNDFQDIYALVQCTPDLSAMDCDGCLIGAIADIPSCCDRKRGGRVLRPSCNLRFETVPFYNETRLQELEARAPDGPGPASTPPPPLSPLSPPTPPPGKGDGNTTLIVIIAVVSVVGCLILAVLVCFLWRRRIKQKSKENLPSRTVEDVDISTAESLQYNLSTLRAATDDFSDSNKLGQGGFGSVYKGKLSSGQEIAVKRLSRDSGQGDLEFKNEVLLLARLQHRNLVRLLGFCLEGTEKLLVYEFIQHASLDLFIFDRIKRTHLDWDKRYKIIGGIARGILYLHEDSRLRIIHRDLKASNVLLDRDMNPKIADFGMARLFGQDETQGNTSRIVGTYGYMPPEYAMHGQFSIKSDVFSFGVLVLEIISGQRNNCFRSGEIVEDLLSFAWKNWCEGTTANMVDPILRSGSGSMSDILRCIHIGLLCVQENAADRPTMASVVLMLNSFSITLSVPKEPAFYSASGYDSEVALKEECNSREIETKSSSKSYKAAQSDHSRSSNNDASITDLGNDNCSNLVKKCNEKNE